MLKGWQIIGKDSVIDSVEDLEEQLLLNRGIKTAKEKEEFFNPKLEDYEKDFELSGINAAKKRIEKAIEDKELIIVYGDYDVDGLCGTAILYLGLTSLGAKVLPYIPHREKEGYGLSKEGLKYVKEEGASLVITVDNGIVAIEQAKLAKKMGLDLIITDHHLPLEEKPEALSIVHSTKMCGASVGWCLVKSLISGEKALELLDLVALATVGDLATLTGVNRALVKEGLKKLNKTKRVGLLALMKDSGLELGNLSTYHLGYILGPRLNAKGRLEHALDALRLLCTKDMEKAKKLAKMLSETNNQKKQLVEDAILEAKEMIRISHLGGGMQKKILILHSKKWIPGIVGLVAGRICEEYKVPTIAISLGGIESKGSARSIKGVNIIETIRQCSEILLAVGGHPQAAGFTIETSKIEIFKSKLEELMGQAVIEEGKSSEVEALVDTKKISKKWLDVLGKFEPFGISNPKPLLAAGDVFLSDLRTVGNGKHLKGKADGLDLIAFGKGELINTLNGGQPNNLVFYLELDQFNGMDKLQLKILDIQY